MLSVQLHEICFSNRKTRREVVVICDGDSRQLCVTFLGDGSRINREFVTVNGPRALIEWAHIPATFLGLDERDAALIALRTATMLGFFYAVNCILYGDRVPQTDWEKSFDLPAKE